MDIIDDVSVGVIEDLPERNIVKIAKVKPPIEHRIPDPDPPPRTLHPPL